MHGKAEVNLEVMITDHAQMNKEEGEMERDSPLRNQVTVTMTEDKGIGNINPNKEEKAGKLKLSDLDSSPLGSFQSLQSSPSSEENRIIPKIPLLGGTRVLKFNGTLSEEDHRSFKLIYESLLLEGRAGNLTNLMLEMVLAEKPLTWLPVIYERLKHLLISSDTFREKKRTSHGPQVGGKGKRNSIGMGRYSKGIKIPKKGRKPCGKGDRSKTTSRDNQRSYSVIGICN